MVCFFPDICTPDSLGQMVQIEKPGSFFFPVRRYNHLLVDQRADPFLGLLPSASAEDAEELSRLATEEGPPPGLEREALLDHRQTLRQLGR